MKPFIWKLVWFTLKNEPEGGTHFDTEAQSISEIANWFKLGTQKCSLCDGICSMYIIIHPWWLGDTTLGVYIPVYFFKTVSLDNAVWEFSLA